MIGNCITVSYFSNKQKKNICLPLKTCIVYHRLILEKVHFLQSSPPPDMKEELLWVNQSTGIRWNDSHSGDQCCRWGKSCLMVRTETK